MGAAAKGDDAAAGRRGARRGRDGWEEKWRAQHEGRAAAEERRARGRRGKWKVPDLSRDTILENSQTGLD
jgi:hypothetical protein